MREELDTRDQVLGIDVGSVTVGVVALDREKRISWSAYAPHHGSIEKTLHRMLDENILRGVGWIAKSSSTPDVIRAGMTVDCHVAQITAARHLHPDLRSLLVVGGERFSLTCFAPDGRYQETKTNSSCAAGTGSFLDQQAKALGLEDGGALAQAALAAKEEAPKIASRCAVFAKTDLIHAQQAGHSREAICDGLCHGLANIVADTVSAGDRPAEPIVLAGGVARNRAVRQHLSQLVGDSCVDECAHLYGALGAALTMQTEQEVLDATSWTVEDIIVDAERAREYTHAPLAVEMSDYPSFASLTRYEYASCDPKRSGVVEVDIYESLPPQSSHEIFLGIDIGSTSTKAVLLDEQKRVVAGFYTRTSGRPIEAMQAIFEAIHVWTGEAGLTFSVAGAGTTGSGRKLIGSVIGADLVVDEISAHARAAFELDPETDTIIEIGGQDAKFTTMRDGMVTFSVMNTVCAAGTGSFIEEQAHRLECPLDEYAEHVAGARAPLASDRCTVFMQRDINHLLAHGYERREILATVLHSVRENYLQKVARQGCMGEHICFQGATAKNRALVAAFEQKLGKKISVSPYCHLTGALGVALMMAEEGVRDSSFRGIDLHRQEIPIQNEVCDLCKNHCKIVTATVHGEIAAYGFLCGRDYHVDHFVSNNRSGFDLLKARRRVLGAPAPDPVRHEATIGLPAALYMVEDLQLWQRFFAELGVRTVTSEKCADPVGQGKKLARAEFCAPMAAFHAHVAHLADETDYVFAPIYLDARHSRQDLRRQYCYYSQYASPLIANIYESRRDGRILRPLIAPQTFQTKARLYTTLKPILGASLTWTRVASAYNKAVEEHAARYETLEELMRTELEHAEKVSVVLLGRPYACLVPSMNKGIPEILASMGIKTFFQDMLTYEHVDMEEIRELLGQVHWSYAAKILESAQVVATTAGLYPVLVTSFKCAPDSCTIEFFRRILDKHGKPYLILELDEHDSAIGYETRLEAAVRSFRNHTAADGRLSTRLPVSPRLSRALENRKLFLPNWDNLSCELVAANLRREGVDAQVLHEDEMTIQRGLRHNTGQCIPLNAIVEGFIRTVTQQDIDPGQTTLWMMDSQIACNLGMIGSMVKALLEAHGQGFEKAAVYVGNISLTEVSLRAAVNTYFAYLFGGMLRRMACRTRPYEMRAGETDAVITTSLETLRRAFESGGPNLTALREVVDRFVAIETSERIRPKVAIFGDLYVRDNEVMSQGLVRFIERHGGEVLTTPYSEFVKVIADVYFTKWLREGKLRDVVVHKSLLATMKVLEKRYLSQFERVLGPTERGRPTRPTSELLELFDVTDRHTGESVDNLLKVFHILDTDPDVSLFVQANPAFCCPSLVTEAMAQRIESLAGVPVVTVTYDGTFASCNDAIIPYLWYASHGRESVAASA
ncbi:acyl-CoA dehydratase activase [Myxococcota bacterium]